MNADAIETQERLWSETLADNDDTVNDARQGEPTRIDVNPKLFHDIQRALSRLVSKAEQLIDNATTNVAESWMHIRTKYDGGKVINRSQSGSWQHRCMGAGLQQNLGKQWGPATWKEMTASTPNKVFTDCAKRASDRLASDKQRKSRDDVKAKRRTSKYSSTDDTKVARQAYSRHNGGVSPDEIDGDVPRDHLEQLKSGYYSTKVEVSAEEAKSIERRTIDQADDEFWMNERRKRITASKVGTIAKMRVTTKCSAKVQQLLYNKFRGNTATRYGQNNEDEARKVYVHYMKEKGHTEIHVDCCGLFISPENPWLAASPDGLVTDPADESSHLGLVEIKKSLFCERTGN